MKLFKAFVVSFSISAASLLTGQTNLPEPGHSHDGAAYDQGPRNFAQLERGTGIINFQTDRCSQKAQEFINQGIGQLHGFLNYESERSFRHAKYLDPTCITAVWGMAMANTIWVGNTERATELIKDARKMLTPSHSDRTRLYIESIEALNDASSGWINFASLLKKIYEQYPTDLDAKAFFLLTVWDKNLFSDFGYADQNEEKQTEYLFDLAKEILQTQPSHPVHHYIVHMWDRPKYYFHALGSADVVGFAGPGIAHMWHMAGHIYDKGQMPFEAAWSQEAAARTDHTYMAKKQIFPFMIHNHAHNNEWLSRTLFSLGDFEKSWKLALNLIAQPKHPTLNNSTQYQHLRTGAERVFDVIEYGSYWDDGQKLFNTPLLKCSQFKDHSEAFANCERVRELVKIKTGATPQINTISNPEYRIEIENIHDLSSGSSIQAAFQNLSSLPHLKSSWGLYSKLRYSLEYGTKNLSLQYAKELLADNPQNLMFLLRAAIAFERAGETLLARKTIDHAQSLSEQLDLTAPEVKDIVFHLSKLGITIDESWKMTFTGWRKIHTKRPQLSSLGPLLWQPIRADDFNYVDKNNQNFNFYNQVGANPTLLVFLLNECPHCDLQAKNILDRKKEFDAQGIEIIFVTSQNANYPAFKSYRAFDDFEDFPLHGIFLINKHKEVVWGDISSDAFQDIDFVIDESERLFHPSHRKALYGIR